MNLIANALSKKRYHRLGLLVAAGVALSACQGGIDSVFPKAETPVSAEVVKKMKAKGMKSSSPILLRIYKDEDILEVWKQKDTGRYALLESFDICKWSGVLGPKFKEGDRQAPEGFYNVGKAQMNPNSQYHLSFNIGYPNTYDRSHGRTGTHLMVHGACSSAGCYSMTDEQVGQIYALARDSMAGGQDYFQVQAYPFRMTAANMAKHAANPHFEFWKMLKEGYDHFELTNYPPKVDVCEKRYVFNREAVDDASFNSSATCPPLTMPKRLIELYSAKRSEEIAEFKKALKREQARAKLRGGELANLDVEQITLVAAGSEILPPPTPRPPAPEPVMPAPSVAENPGVEVPAIAAVEPSVAAETAVSAKVTPASAVPSGGTRTAAAPAIDGTLSAAENEALLRGESVHKPAPAVVAVSTPAIVPTPSPVKTPVVGDENQAQAGTVVQEAVVPVPVPAPRESAEAVAPPKKTPWWARKKPATGS